jgi:hypothetical protein
MVVAAGLALAACGSKEPDINRNMPTDTAPITVPTVAQGGRDPFSTASPSATPAFPIEANNSSAVTETDDSFITSTNDNLGNRIETRSFKASARLSKVVVLTPPKGRKQARVYGNRGEVKELPAALVLNALIMTADELADAVGIAMDKSPKRTAPPVEKPSPTPHATPVATPSPKAKPAASPSASVEPEP